MNAVAVAKRSRLINQLTEDNVSISILGYLVWWSIRNVDIDQERFAECLEECEIDEKYAREHNYLSAFKRALHNMEEARIIRIVEESPVRILCQFTAENKVETKRDGPRFDYDPETVIHIDKIVYKKAKDFAQALVKGDEQIKKQLVEHYQKEKIRYNSNDITRYIQKILNDQADILSLRDQGCLYFIPSGYAATMEKVQRLVRMIQSGNTFECVPLPDVRASRSLVSTAVTAETELTFDKLETEVAAMLQTGQEVTEVWKDTRLRRLRQLRKRLSDYAEVLGDEGDKMVASTEKLEEQIVKVGAVGQRKLKI